jgi:hypothetical protein
MSGWMTLLDDGSVSVSGFRFVPMLMKIRTASGVQVFEPVPGVYALPGGGWASQGDLPVIARRMQAWMEGRPWM